VGEEKRYAQDAVVALVQTDPPAHSAAFERFTPEGPLALLPFAGRYAMVWSRRPEKARVLAAAPEAEFLAELGAAAGHRPGRPVKVEARAVHPLVLRVRAARIARARFHRQRGANAAPGRRQGLTSACAMPGTWRRSGAGRATRATRAMRRRSALRGAPAPRRGGHHPVTDFLAGAFLGSNRIARGARGAALAALDVFPPARRFFARRMIYGPSALP